MALKIELQRAFSPDEAVDDECAICGERFERASVVATLTDEHLIDMGVPCPACVAALGQLEVETDGVRRFPTAETFEEALRRHPEPLLGSSEEWAQAERLGLYDDFYSLSWAI